MYFGVTHCVLLIKRIRNYKDLETNEFFFCTLMQPIELEVLSSFLFLPRWVTTVKATLTVKVTTASLPYSIIIVITQDSFNIVLINHFVNQFILAAKKLLTKRLLLFLELYSTMLYLNVDTQCGMRYFLTNQPPKSTSKPCSWASTRTFSTGVSANRHSSCSILLHMFMSE